jgi:chromosome partitioning protein
MERRAKVAIMANQKGGVGKSTTTFALKDEFCKTLGLRTLVIDYDPQGSLTDLFDLEKDVLKECREVGGIANIFERKDVAIIEIEENLDLIPSDPRLNDAFYSSKSGKDLMLQKYIEKIRGDYDLILIDTKPDIQTPLVSAILAADIIINPIKAGGIEEAATILFYNKLEETVDIYNKKIEKIFVIPTMVESSRDSKEALFSIKHNLPEIYTRDYKALSDIPMEILRPIPRRAVFSNATGVKVSIRKYIEESDTGKRDILLDLEQIAKKIAAV